MIYCESEERNTKRGRFDVYPERSPQWLVQPIRDCNT
jgi:hypothetical protein